MSVELTHRPRMTQCEVYQVEVEGNIRKILNDLKALAATLSSAVEYECFMEFGKEGEDMPSRWFVRVHNQWIISGASKSKLYRYDYRFGHDAIDFAHPDLFIAAALVRSLYKLLFEEADFTSVNGRMHTAGFGRMFIAGVGEKLPEYYLGFRISLNRDSLAYDDIICTMQDVNEVEHRRSVEIEDSKTYEPFNGFYETLKGLNIASVTSRYSAVNESKTPGEVDMMWIPTAFVAQLPSSLSDTTKLEVDKLKVKNPYHYTLREPGEVTLSYYLNTSLGVILEDLLGNPDWVTEGEHGVVTVDVETREITAKHYDKASEEYNKFQLNF